MLENDRTSFTKALARTLAILSVAVVATTAPASAQDTPDAALFCPQLKEINNHAMTQQRFASIIGKPRTGNYRDTTVPLPGWTDCMMYGTSTYTCDSPEFKSREEAGTAQQRIARDVLACFAGTWEMAPEQMSPDFVVLHPKLGPASITLNLDQTDTQGHIVRLIIFLRRP